MRLHWSGAALISGVLALGPALAGENGCADRSAVIDYLAQHHQEAPISRGIANNGGVIEVLAAPDGSSWTILITMPDGETCMVAAGTDWGQSPSAVQSAEVDSDPGA